MMNGADGAIGTDEQVIDGRVLLVVLLTAVLVTNMMTVLPSESGALPVIRMTQAQE